jgi:hypothetical protein
MLAVATYYALAGLQQFKEVELMSEDDRSTIKKLIDAFIIKKKVQKLTQ